MLATGSTSIPIFKAMNSNQGFLRRHNRVSAEQQVSSGRTRVERHVSSEEAQDLGRTIDDSGGSQADGGDPHLLPGWIGSEEACLYVDPAQGIADPIWAKAAGSFSIGSQSDSMPSQSGSHRSSDPVDESLPIARSPAVTDPISTAATDQKYTAVTDQKSPAVTQRDQDTISHSDRSEEASAVTKTNPAKPTSDFASEPVMDQTQLRVDAADVLQTGPHAFKQRSGQPGSSNESRTEQTDADAKNDSDSTLFNDEDWIPQWELDYFEIPDSVDELFFQSKLKDELGERLATAVKGGLKSMLVTSEKTREGRTTVALGMALAAAAGGLDVALVDVDVSNPTLYDKLRLELDYGWGESIRAGLPLSEVAVYSKEDGITLIPLMPTSQGSQDDAAQDDAFGGKTGDLHAVEIETRAPIDPVEANAIIERVSRRFDLVIVDGPPGCDPMLYRIAPMIDSVVLVRDVKTTPPDSVNALAYRLREFGVQGVGVVENFSQA